MTRNQTMLNRALLPAFVAATLLVPATASAASDVAGVWFNDTGRGAIEIKPCGGGMCGHVVWVKDGSDAKGCGRQIIGDAKALKSGVWDNGWIYSPEKKKRYDVELKPLDTDRLRVTGYAGSKFFSKTMIWKRAPADLQRCGTETAKAPAPAAAPAVETAAAAPAAATAVTADKPDERTPEARLRAELNKEATATEKSAPPQATDESPANTETAEADTGETETADAGGLDLGKLNVDKYLKRENGNCKLDLPWVKVDFKCEER